MSSEIGYGAAAIRSGEVRYQQSVVELMKQSAKKPETETSSDTTKSKPSEHQGKKVDVTA